MRNRLKAILDDYYGESRDDHFKEEIIDLLEMQGDLIAPILIEDQADYSLLQHEEGTVGAAAIDSILDLNHT